MQQNHDIHTTGMPADPATIANSTAATTSSGNAGGSAPAPFNRSESEPFSDSWSWDITVRPLQEGETATVHGTLGADDLATLTVGDLNLNLGPRGQYGGGSYESVSDQAPIEPGTHQVNLSYQNISLPEGMPNAAILDYSVHVEVTNSQTGTSTSYVPDEADIEPIDNDDEGDEEPCDQTSGLGFTSSNPCPDEEDNGAGNNGESSSNPCENNAGGAAAAPASARSSTLSPAASSSGAGKQVTARGGRKDMLWRMNFGTFRGMPGMPDGYLEIRQLSASSAMWSPASLQYDHPMESELRFADSTAGLQSSSPFQLVKGGSRLNGYCYAGTRASLIAGSAKRGGSLSYSTGNNRTDGEAYLSYKTRGGAITRFAGSSASSIRRASSYTAKNGRTYTRSELSGLHSVVRNASGVIQQIFNQWDGLMTIRDTTATGYRMAFFLPHQVGTADPDTGLRPTTGEPFKTIDITGDPATNKLTITETTNGRTPYTLSFWQHSSGAWCMARGTGDDAIYTLAEKQDITATGYKLITTVQRGAAGTPVSCLCETYTIGKTGQLCTSRIEGYGSDTPMETTFAYDSMGRKIKETAPDGSEKSWSYDAAGRQTVSMVPWADGGYLATYTYYRVENDADPDIAYQRVTLTKTATQLRRTDYIYTEQDHIRRVVATTVALGAEDPRTEITETWLGSAAPLQQGRLRMTQAPDGIQTWYDYSYDSSYGALYKVTAETRINAEPVAGQSRRTITYISAEGNNLRNESYILLPDGNTWALLSSETFQYDSENRWILRTRGNGRSTRRIMSCSGPLWIEDEDGVISTISYSSARERIEIIRAQVSDGGHVITPETISTFTWDAAGRLTSLRQDYGAMTTTTSSTYDLLGRTTSETDALGRTTTAAYSADGLTTTVTTPAGATLITTRNPDGSIASLSGTGQRAQQHSYSVASGSIRHTITLADGSTLAQTSTNGFGDTIITAAASTSGLIYARREYNAKGQLTRSYQDAGTTATAMAATVYEYDSMGNISKETLVLDEDAPADATRNRIRTSALSCEQQEDGTIWQVLTQTRNNAEGTMKTSTQKTLLSESATLESKTLTTDERGLTSTQSIAYTSDNSMARLHTETIPTSTLAATARVVDGFVTTQTDHQGITSSFTRAYTATGITLTSTDGRGNTTTTHTDLAGRTISSTDAAGNTTTTVYDAAFDQPSVITNAQGKTSCYKYDLRGRKVAEWGTAIQPALFGYDDADNLTALTTFRADSGDITTDPSERTDGDTTTWAYHPTAGVELSKTYADNSQVVKTYDAFNRLVTETNARGIVKTLSYDAATGQLTGISFSDEATPSQSFAYNILGQLTQVTDAAGTRALAYNEYGELQSDSLDSGAHTHLVTELRDNYGRSTGFTYARSGATQFTTSVSYGEDGRIATAGFMHGGVNRQFSYGYLSGSNLLHTLTQPNGLTLTQSYEEHRDLLTDMQYHRGSTLVVERSYSYDTLGRPTNRSTARQSSVKNDTFTHNDRSELTAATLGTDAYSYSYDNIGNRKTAQEAAEEATAYDANNLNQYTSIQEGTAEAFVPTFDADGNQTKVQTSTGIWNVVYNAENRPVTFTSEDGATVVECTYDYMGRRHTRKITVNGSVTNYLRYIYRGYLQIAAINAVSGAFQWFILWDPTQPVATRPLGIRKDGTWYTYGWDLTKNICEVFGSDGYIKTAYTYTPYGAVTANGNVTQPIQWSSEYNDTELGLVYYNYRHYNPADGRWTGKDRLSEQSYPHQYTFVKNSILSRIDQLGLNDVVISGGIDQHGGSKPQNILGQGDKHDRNWRNFVDAARGKIEKWKEEGDHIEWFVEKSSYHGRAAEDWFTSDEEYIKEIEKIADSYGSKVTLRWYRTKSELQCLLAKAPGNQKREEKNQIRRLTYYGHGVIGALMPLPGFGKANVNEFYMSPSDFPKGAFMENPTLEFVTCHSASRSKSNPKALSFAELINERVGGTTIGYHGRVSYLNVAKSWMNAPTKGKEEDVSDDALPPKTSHPRNIPERFTFPL